MSILRRYIFTGRNEVLAKVIFSQASVCPQWGGGVSQHALQVSPGGSPIFWVGVGGSPIFRGGGVSTGIRNTVNVRPVRILLECILLHLEFLILGLSSNCNVDELEKRWLICKDHKPSPMTLLSALMHNEEEVQTSYFVNASNKFSSEPSMLCFILWSKLVNEFILLKLCLSASSCTN